MILYHGSNILVDKIDLTKSNKHKDFGQAFYLSDDKGQALKMGEFKVKILNCGSPILSAFDFDESLLGTHSSLNVKIFPSYSLEWAEFVWNNRDEQQEFHHPYDIVYGPIANDTIGFQMRMFRINGGDLHSFLKGLKYSKGETFQYAFCTDKAINYLRRLEL